MPQLVLLPVQRQTAAQTHLLAAAAAAADQMQLLGQTEQQAAQVDQMQHQTVKMQRSQRTAAAAQKVPSYQSSQTYQRLLLLHC
jgi:hypothetical protein